MPPSAGSNGGTRVRRPRVTLAAGRSAPDAPALRKRFGGSTAISSGGRATRGCWPRSGMAFQVAAVVQLLSAVLLPGQTSARSLGGSEVEKPYVERPGRGRGRSGASTCTGLLVHARVKLVSPLQAVSERTRSVPALESRAVACASTCRPQLVQQPARGTCAPRAARPRNSAPGRAPLEPRERTLVRSFHARRASGLAHRRADGAPGAWRSKHSYAWPGFWCCRK